MRLIPTITEGDYVPSYLASVARRDADRWQALKSRLEAFGSASGLFDEITVRKFGASEGDPFQIQVRKAQRPEVPSAEGTVAERS